MNRIELSAVSTASENGIPYRGLFIAIDGVNLVELVKAHELPFATAEKHPKIAGAYAWRQLGSDVRNSFLGVEYDENEKAMLLQCPCGEPGCWPLLASIHVGENTVVWCGFEQPHRSAEYSSHPWSYEDFGPFKFHRSVYEAAINGLA